MKKRIRKNKYQWEYFVSNLETNTRTSYIFDDLREARTFIMWFNNKYPKHIGHLKKLSKMYDANSVIDR